MHRNQHKEQGKVCVCVQTFSFFPCFWRTRRRRFGNRCYLILATLFNWWQMIKFKKTKQNKNKQKNYLWTYRKWWKGGNSTKSREHTDGPSLTSLSAPIISEAKDFRLKTPKRIIIKEMTLGNLGNQIKCFSRLTGENMNSVVFITFLLSQKITLGFQCLESFTLIFNKLFFSKQSSMVRIFTTLTPYLVSEKYSVTEMPKKKKNSRGFL